MRKKTAKKKAGSAPPLCPLCKTHHHSYQAHRFGPPVKNTNRGD